MDKTNKISISLDSLLPPAVASKVEDIGVKKGNLDFVSMFMLAVLALGVSLLGVILYQTDLPEVWRHLLRLGWAGCLARPISSHSGR